MATIALLTDPRHKRAAATLRDRLLEHWPKGRSGGDISIMVRYVGEGLPPANLIDACIILYPADIAEEPLFEAARRLYAAHVPIVTAGRGRDPRLAEWSMYSLEASADPGVMTGLIAGLAIRTPAVRQFEENLKFAQSVHESVSRLVEQFQDDQLLAASIQRQFVSQEMPKVEGISCAAMFRPVDYLSGDIYRVTRLDADHIGFFLGDAMGHGLPAALMALYIAGRVTQRETVGDETRIITPAESMTRLNRDLAATGCSNVRFATAVCGTMNVRTHEVQIAAAGHPPPLVLGWGSTRKIEVGGPLLGVMDDTEYEQTSFPLDQGQTLILYSDGVEDSLNPREAGEEKGTSPRTRHIEFLESVANEVGGADPEKMFARFTQMLDSQTGSMHPVDDLTLVGIRTAA